MAEVYQIFIKHLDGRTQCLRLATPTISGSALKQALLRSTARIPAPHSVRLISCSTEISDSTVLSASGSDHLFPSCTLLLRLRGGKGGFGSLLRGAATKAGQKKTNNFDACRDMSGRRLRHVNAEKKLEEWKAEAEERKLEKIAEEFLKKKTKAAKKAGPGGGAAAEKYIEKYREDAAKCMEVVEASVRESFGLYENGKRKVLPASGPATKRVKIWLGKGKEVESDSDDEDDENNEDVKSVVLDDASCCVQNKQDESSGSASVVQSDEEASGGGSMESNLEEETGNCDNRVIQLGEGSMSRNSDADAEGSVQPESGVFEQAGTELGEVPGINAGEVFGEVSGTRDVIGSMEPKSGVCPQGGSELGEGSGSIAINAGEEGSGSRAVNADMEGYVEPKSRMPGIIDVQGSSISSLDGALNFEEFNSAAEMEVLGLERLKMELQTHGLKCGGTLQERAARLFLLKTTPVEKLPKKLLAKTKGDGK